MDQHHRNSLAVAEYLETSPFVDRVHHPWLKSHPQHNVAVAQTTGHSGMVAFYVKGGLTEADRLLQSLRLVSLCGSLGGTESTAVVPALMTHYWLTEERRIAGGITGNLVRLSVGIENANDLIADLEQAFKVVYDDV